jgi:HlyD family secretion protein
MEAAPASLHRLGFVDLRRSTGGPNFQDAYRPSRTRPIRIVILALACCALLGPEACTRLAPQAVQGSGGDNGVSNTVKVERRNFRRTVRLHGTVEAVQSYNVIAPRLAGQTAMTMVMTKLVRNGTRVRKGDVLVEFDRQTQMQNVLDREADYDNLLAQIKKKQADQAAAKAQDDTELKGAEVDVQSARVDMRKNGLVSTIDAEINIQNLAEAEAKLKQLQETYALKRQAEVADLRVLEIQRDRAHLAMVYAQTNIEKMTITSPLDGLVVLTPVYRGSRYVDPQEGDEVRPGYPVMLVVNPLAMQVRARVNQVDISCLQPGQTVEVRLDAYPDMVFHGSLDRLGAIGSASYYSTQLRNFSAIVAIQGSSPKLVPDLTAAADVVVESLDNVLVLPREAIVHDRDQTMVEVWVGGRSELRPVKIGAMNDCEVVISSGVEEGTAVTRNVHLNGQIGRQQPD